MEENKLNHEEEKNKRKRKREGFVIGILSFLLLLSVSFILTTSLIRPSALNLKLPENKIQVDEEPEKIIINSDGSFWLNGDKISSDGLSSAIQDLQSKNGGKKLNLTISPRKGAPTKAVVEVIATVRVLGANGILTVAE